MYTFYYVDIVPTMEPWVILWSIIHERLRVKSMHFEPGPFLSSLIISVDRGFERERGIYDERTLYLHQLDMGSRDSTNSIIIYWTDRDTTSLIDIGRQLHLPTEPFEYQQSKDTDGNA